MKAKHNGIEGQRMSKQYNERFTDADLKKMAELLAALQNQPVQRERELGIDFLELAQTLWKKAWAILLAAVIIVGSFLACTVFFSGRSILPRRFCMSSVCQ